jgi:dTDP-4-dehydrorhamnose 3,5-epimerase
MTKPSTAHEGFEKIDGGLEGVVLLRPTVFRDARGQFLESYHEAKFAALGIHDRFVQDNQSRSVRGTLRGLHYQLKHSQAKICRVVQGEVLDVAVDIRRGSPNFGKWTGVVLSGENGLQIYIPPGFAHGFLVLSESADFLYKCSDFYDRDDEHGIRWNDPTLGIRWNEDSPLLSAKDAALPLLSEVPAELLPKYEAF